MIILYNLKITKSNVKNHEQTNKENLKLGVYKCFELIKLFILVTIQYYTYIDTHQSKLKIAKKKNLNLNIILQSSIFIFHRFFVILISCRK